MDQALPESEARFRAMADHIPQLAWMARPDGWIFWYNRRWFDYTGTTLADMQGWGWRAVHHPDQRAGVEARFKASLDAGEPWEDTFPLRRADGEFRWFLSRANPVRDAAGRITLWFGTNTDISNRLQIEAELREREAELARVQRIGRLGGFQIDLSDGGFRNRRSPEYLRLHGLPPDATEESHGAWVQRLHPEDRERVDWKFREAVAGDARDYSAEYRILLPDGGVRWICVIAEIERDAAGRPLRMVGAHMDTTARKADESRQALLAREVDHRAKNVLAVVQSVLRLTRAADPADYRRAVEGRIAALARAHSLLAEHHWDRTGLRELLETELAPFQGGGRVSLTGPPLDVAPSAVQPLAMAVHELVTNAAKHGALSVTGGRVALDWSLDRAADALRLDWVETGGPPVTSPGAQGFGMRVIEATLRDQLGGWARLDWPAGGLACVIILPAPRAVCPPRPA